jgi:hypothetical protein
MAKVRDETKMREISRDNSRDGKETRTKCATCEMAFRGRNPQIVTCCVCKLVVHRTCLPEDLANTDYVRMKKYKEA